MSDSISVLVVLDLSPSTPGLLHRACALARAHPGCRLHLLHVLDPALTAAMANWGLGTREELHARSLALATDELAALARRCATQGGQSVELSLLEGRPLEQIAASCQRLRPDLVLAGGGNRLWREALLGSTARRLLSTVPGPLWLARGDDAPELSMALVACDFSDACAAAVHCLRRFWPGAALQLLHVLDSRLDPPTDLVDAATAAAVAALRETEARAALDAFTVRWAGDAPLHWQVRAGHPVKQLHEAQAALRAPLVVLGRHAAGPRAQGLGSVAEALVQRVDADLLLGPLGV